MEIVENRIIFLRDKKSVETRILGVFLYSRALSYRDISKVLGAIEGCSHEAAQYWYTQFKDFFVANCKE